MTAIPRKPLSPPLMVLPTVRAVFDALTESCGLTQRRPQLRLAEITRSTLAGGVAVVEAPTGTGKTLGYLTGALDYQAHAGTPLPVVVATATVSLQEQILRYDIPRLAAIGALDPKKVAIAKGRSRYFCPRTAALLEDKKMQDSQADMFNAEKHIAEGGVTIALDMLKAWRAKGWDGEQDSWPGELPGCWSSSCAASSETCVGRTCAHHADCPYMLSRARLGAAQLIIANQDMVLADLAQRADEQQTTALPPKRYALVVDEAHNFPEKAIATLRAEARVSDTDWLREIERFSESVWGTNKVAKSLTKAICAGDFPDTVFSVDTAKLVAELEQLAKELGGSKDFKTDGILSWGLTRPAENLLLSVGSIAAKAVKLMGALQVVAKGYAGLAEDSVGPEKSFAVRMLAQTHRFQTKIDSLHKGLLTFFTGDGLVRWASRTPEGQVALHAQPMEGSDVLTKLLWNLEIPVVMVSATLQVGDKFRRFKLKTGLPGHATTEALPPVFDYSRGFLHEPKMPAAPGEAGYEAGLADAINRLYKADTAPGMLILFTSRMTMRRVMGACSPEVRDAMLMAGGAPIPELVARHKANIDAGSRSILVGLDSMAEGLDLPGRYCGHVVITRLPFSVPSDPVEVARKERMGKAWFDDVYLADMLTTLIQACGRLIRREDDHGIITLLDNRLKSKRYAELAYASLPTFTRCSTLKEYREAATKRGFDMRHGVKPAVTAIMPMAPKAPALTVVTGGKKEGAAAGKKAEAPALTVVATQPNTLPALADLCVMRAGTSPRQGGEFTEDWLTRICPPERGEFDCDVPLMDCDIPCLPAGTPATAWAERGMAESYMLACWSMSNPTASACGTWRWVMLHRPDVVQYTSILRSHEEGRDDPRRKLFAAVECRRQLDRIFGGNGFDMPSDGELFYLLEQLEDKLTEYLSAPYLEPSREYQVALIEERRASLRKQAA